MSVGNGVKFVVVGCGHIGKQHAELIKAHPEAKLLATVDPKDIYTLGIEKFDVPHYHDLAELIKANIGAEVVNICTPNGLHAVQAIDCLEHGMHVVIEKPIALHKKEASEILQSSQKNNRYVFPVVQNRYSSTIRWLKEIVDNKSLGKIFIVQLNCFWNRNEHYYKEGRWHGSLILDGGPLYTQFSHFIDILLWVFGDITNIQTKFFDFNHQASTSFEDSGMLWFDFVNGGVCSMNYSTSIYEYNFESSITVIAENGTIKIGGQYMNHIDYCYTKNIEKPLFLDEQSINNYGLYEGSAVNHQFVIDNVIDTIRGRDEQHVSLEEGLAVVDVINRMYKNRNCTDPETADKEIRPGAKKVLIEDE